MNIGFLTINNGRQKVLNLWCASMNRLRDCFGVFPAVCVSGKEDNELCVKYGIHHITSPNPPASNKWNDGLRWLKEQSLDYVCITGSDDVFSNEALANIIFATDTEPDIIGFSTIYVYCADGVSKGRLKVLSTRGVLGVGKTVHKRVLDAVDWKAWNYGIPKSWGMDSIFSRTTSQYVKTRVMVDGVIVDVKTAESLNKFSMFEKNKHGTYADSKIFFNIMGEEEKKILADIEGRPASLSHWMQTSARNSLL